MLLDRIDTKMELRKYPPPVGPDRITLRDPSRFPAKTPLPFRSAGLIGHRCPFRLISYAFDRSPSAMPNRAAIHRQRLRVSVCIPTCARPALVTRAVGSILAQTQLPFEILIGDDSDDDATAEALGRMQAESEIPIRLFRNHVRLGQGRNVGNLINHAEGDAVLLLHDDDTIVPRGIEILSAPFDNEVVIATFGKSWSIDLDGRIDTAYTEELNSFYHRMAQHQGIICDALVSAAVQQIPGSGFLVRKHAARAASYDEAANYLNACDYVFNVKLALRTPGSFYFCDELVHCYHQTHASLGKSATANSAVMAFAYAHTLEEKIGDRELYQEWMRDRSSVAIRQSIRLGLLAQGWRWYFGRYHRSRIASMSGIQSALMLLWAFFRGRHRIRPKLTIPSVAESSATDAAPANEIAANYEARLVVDVGPR